MSQRLFNPGDRVRFINLVDRVGVVNYGLVIGQIYAVDYSYRQAIGFPALQDISVVNSGLWHAAESFERVERGEVQMVEGAVLEMIRTKSKPELRAA